LLYPIINESWQKGDKEVNLATEINNRPIS